ncbi:hypothetical protein GGC63_002102 [Paenibacillus sp. OAS669]|nr:hypothetical protein [Paenibacillus sp. OAS669]
MSEDHSMEGLTPVMLHHWPQPLFHCCPSGAAFGPPITIALKSSKSMEALA